METPILFWMAIALPSCFMLWPNGKPKQRYKIGRALGKNSSIFWIEAAVRAQQAIIICKYSALIKGLHGDWAEKPNAKAQIAYKEAKNTAIIWYAKMRTPSSRKLVAIILQTGWFFSRTVSSGHTELQQRIPQRAKTEWKGYSKHNTTQLASAYDECFMQQKDNLCKIEHIICTYCSIHVACNMYTHWIHSFICINSCICESVFPTWVCVNQFPTNNISNQCLCTDVYELVCMRTPQCAYIVIFSSSFLSEVFQM